MFSKITKRHGLVKVEPIDKNIGSRLIIENHYLHNTMNYKQEIILIKEIGKVLQEALLIVGYGNTTILLEYIYEHLPEPKISFNDYLSAVAIWEKGNLLNKTKFPTSEKLLEEYVAARLATSYFAHMLKQLKSLEELVNEQKGIYNGTTENQ